MVDRWRPCSSSTSAARWRAPASNRCRTPMLSAREFIKPDHRGRCRRVQRHRHASACDDRRVRSESAGQVRRDRRGPRAGWRHRHVRRHRARAPDARRAARCEPRVKPILVVLTDGETTDGLQFDRRRQRHRGAADPDLHRGLRSRPRGTRVGCRRSSRLRVSMRVRKTSSSRSQRCSTPAADVRWHRR